MLNDDVVVDFVHISVHNYITRHKTIGVQPSLFSVLLCVSSCYEPPSLCDWATVSKFSCAIALVFALLCAHSLLFGVLLLPVPAFSAAPGTRDEQPKC